MKILSVFHRGNEIGVHTNFLGKKTITYNGKIVLEQFTLSFSPLFKFREGPDEYHIKLGYHWSGGYGADVWCGTEPILLGLDKYHVRPRTYPAFESDYV